jgi:hypothetical protein
MLIHQTPCLGQSGSPAHFNFPGNFQATGKSAFPNPICIAKLRLSPFNALP